MRTSVLILVAAAALLAPPAVTAQTEVFINARDRILVADPDLGAITTEINVGPLVDVRIWDLVFSPVSGHLYALVGDVGRPWRLTQIDAASRAVSGNTDLGQLLSTFLGILPNMEISTDGATVYVGAGIPSRIIAIHTATMTLTTSVTVDSSEVPQLVINPNGASLYGLFQDSQQRDVHVFDAATLSTLTSLQIGRLGLPVFSPLGNRLYVAVRGDYEDVVTIETSNHSVVRRQHVTTSQLCCTHGLAAAPSGETLYLWGLHRTIALDAFSGEILWETFNGSDHRDTEAVAGPGRLYLVGGDGRVGACSSELPSISCIRALDASSGALVSRIVSPPHENLFGTLVLGRPLEAPTDLRLDPVVGTYLGTAQLTARLSSFGVVQSGAVVSFSLNGAPVGTAVTNSSGIASLVVNLSGLNGGHYPAGFRATFSGAGGPTTAETALHIYKAMPSLTWPQPAKMLSTSPLAGGQLNASANVPGTFVYDPPAGTILPVGFQRLNVTFQPQDSTNYASVAAHITLEVALWSPESQPSLILSRPPGPGLSGLPYPDQGARRLYAVKSGAVSILDSATLSEISSLVVPARNASAVTVDAEQRRLYVAVYQHELWVYDLTQPGPTLSVLPHNPISLPATNVITDLKINEQTDLVYVTSADGNAYVVDPSSTTNPIATIAGPVSVLSIHSPLNMIIVTGKDVNGRFVGLRVFEGDPLRGPLDQLVGTLRGSFIYPNIASNRRTNEVYVTDFENKQLVVYRPAAVGFDQQPVATIPLTSVAPRIPLAVVTNASTNMVYVMSADINFALDGGAVISGIDATTRAIRSHTLLSPEQYYDAALGLSLLSIDSATSTLFSLTQSFGMDAVRDSVTQTENVPAGGSADLGAISITLPAGMAGVVSVSSIDPSTLGSSTGQFILEGALAFEIQTSQPLTGTINVCFNASSISDEDLFNALTVIHYVGGQPIVETSVTERDFSSGRICVNVTSLSPFVLARRENRYSVQILHDTSRAFRAGSTAPLKIRILGSNGANLSSSAVALTAKYLVKISDASSAAVQDSGNANPDSTFRYDPQLAGYILNLQTKGLASGSYELKFKAAGDPRLHAVPLQIR